MHRSRIVSRFSLLRALSYAAIVCAFAPASRASAQGMRASYEEAARAYDEAAARAEDPEYARIFRLNAAYHRCLAAQLGPNGPSRCQEPPPLPGQGSGSSQGGRSSSSSAGSSRSGYSNGDVRPTDRDAAVGAVVGTALSALTGTGKISASEQEWRDRQAQELAEARNSGDRAKLRAQITDLESQAQFEEERAQSKDRMAERSDESATQQKAQGGSGLAGMISGSGSAFFRRQATKYRQEATERRQRARELRQQADEVRNQLDAMPVAAAAPAPAPEPVAPTPAPEPAPSAPAYVAPAAPAPPADIPELGARVAEIRFFERGADRVPLAQRTYATSFDAKTTRSIAPELRLAHGPPGQRVEAEVACTFLRADGSTVGTASGKLVAEAEWSNTVWSPGGVGWAESGRWLPGAYRVGCTYSGRTISDGAFQIVAATTLADRVAQLRASPTAMLPAEALKTLREARAAGTSDGELAPIAIAVGTASLVSCRSALPVDVSRTDSVTTGPSSARRNCNAAQALFELAAQLAPSDWTRFMTGWAAYEAASAALADAQRGSSCESTQEALARFSVAQRELPAAEQVTAEQFNGATVLGTQLLQKIDEVTPFARKLEQSFCATSPASTPASPSPVVERSTVRSELTAEDLAIVMQARELAKNGRGAEALAAVVGLRQSGVVAETAGGVAATLSSDLAKHCDGSAATSDGGTRRSCYGGMRRLAENGDSLFARPGLRLIAGVAALRVGMSALEDASKLRSCELARVAEESFAAAAPHIQAGATTPEGSTQLLAIVANYARATDNAVKSLCT